MHTGYCRILRIFLKSLGAITSTLHRRDQTHTRVGVILEHGVQKRQPQNRTGALLLYLGETCLPEIRGESSGECRQRRHNFLKFSCGVLLANSPEVKPVNREPPLRPLLVVESQMSEIQNGASPCVFGAPVLYTRITLRYNFASGLDLP